MAFNPFHRFRKHQKAFLAALAVLCMIIFVFQFGAGDVFTRALQWVGASGGKGEVVTKLYGDKVFERDLDVLRRQRRVAHEFLTNLTPPQAYGIFPPPLGMFLILDTTVSQIAEQQARSQPEAGTPPLPALVSHIPSQILQRFQQMRSGFASPTLETAEQNLQQVRAALSSPAVGQNPDQIRNLQSLAAALAWEAYWNNPDRPKDELLFGGTISPEDLLDFLIWKHQADRLGITVTDGDVGREINRMAGNPNPPLFGEEGFDRNPYVRVFLRADDPQRRRADTSYGDLVEALRQEFRVQLAKEALLGQGSGVRAYFNEAEPVWTSPAAATPDEFLQFFRRERTTLRVAVLPLAVGNFVEKVEGQPGEEELHNLYETYKDKVPDPARREPGFKEPRRIKVQYARVDSDSAFYQTKGKELAKLYQGPVPGAVYRAGAAGLPGWSALAALAESPDALAEEYQRYRSEIEGELRFSPRLNAGIDLRDRRPGAARPQAYVGTLGVLLGMGQTGLATPVSAAALAPGLDAAHRAATLQAFGSQVLAGATARNWTAPTLPYFFTTQQPLSEADARPMIVERFEKSLARRTAQDNIQKFEEELAKKRAKPAEAQQYVEKAVKELGLEDLTATPRLDSKYELAEDPALKKLREVYDKDYESRKRALEQFPALRRQMPEPKPFADMLFEGGELYNPRPITGQSGDTWLVWRTADKPAKERSYEEVRGEVEASWRFDRARRLARAEAERIRRAIDEKHLNAEDAERFLRDQKGATVFELTNVARLLPTSTFLVGREDRAEFRRYEVPADKIAYAPADFVDRLLTLKEPGSALVMPDLPSKHFYVVVLLARSEPPLRDFYNLYAKPWQNDPIWIDLMHQRRSELHRDLLKQLRREAAGPDGVDAAGNLKLPENVRKSGEASPEE
jgi:hypothetical protein